MLTPAVWITLGGFCGAFLVLLALIGHWMRTAEVGLDPYAGLPTFDDDEAQQLLDAGA
jgi:hypothetical protein